MCKRQKVAHNPELDTLLANCVFHCEHNGILINGPLVELKAKGLLDQVKIPFAELPLGQKTKALDCHVICFVTEAEAEKQCMKTKFIQIKIQLQEPELYLTTYH